MPTKERTKLYPTRKSFKALKPGTILRVDSSRWNDKDDEEDENGNHIACPELVITTDRPISQDNAVAVLWPLYELPYAIYRHEILEVVGVLDLALHVDLKNQLAKANTAVTMYQEQVQDQETILRTALSQLVAAVKSHATLGLVEGDLLDTSINFASQVLDNFDLVQLKSKLEKEYEVIVHTDQAKSVKYLAVNPIQAVMKAKADYPTASKLIPILPGD